MGRARAGPAVSPDATARDTPRPSISPIFGFFRESKIITGELLDQKILRVSPHGRCPPHLLPPAQTRHQRRDQRIPPIAKLLRPYRTRSHVTTGMLGARRNARETGITARPAP